LQSSRFLQYCSSLVSIDQIGIRLTQNLRHVLLTEHLKCRRCRDLAAF
jgi:hypothetical protein